MVAVDNHRLLFSPSSNALHYTLLHYHSKTVVPNSIQGVQLLIG